MALRHAEKQEELTKEQFETCLIEAIKSGDFVRHCEPVTSYIDDKHELRVEQKQYMTYAPYYQANSLKLEIAKLEDIITNYEQFIARHSLIDDWLEYIK